MNILSLNVWGGRMGQAVIDFLAAQAETVDIFCLQEVFHGGSEQEAEISENVQGKNYAFLLQLRQALPGYQIFFCPTLGDWYGLAVLVREGIEGVGEAIVPIHGVPGTIPEGDLGLHGRVVQSVAVRVGEGVLHVLNVHGLWNGQGKTDTPERIAQSQAIVEYCASLTQPYVLLGDLNLTMSTQSIALLEHAGMRNLVREFGVTSTRTSHYAKADRYADYAFVSAGVTVEDFRVLSEEVSDHAPLLLRVAM